MKHTRARYQLGSLTTEKRMTGPDVWVFRWREPSDGRIVKRKKILGDLAELPNQSAAMRKVGALRLQINEEASANQEITVAELVEHYRAKELTSSESKTPRTVAVYEQHFRQHILPRWGALRLSQVKAVDVEAWLRSLPQAPGTKAKMRNVMGCLYQHAMRYAWATTNPIRLVRQSSKRLTEPDVLSTAEVASLLRELQEPSRTIVLLAVTTGMRRGEIFGLRWEDLDLGSMTVHVVRSLVDQVEGRTKTAGSKRLIPLDPSTTEALKLLQAATDYKEPLDWVFASPTALGSKPYWPNTLLTRHIKPTATQVGISKQIGWHTFRRTFATLLHSAGANVKTTQEILGHASPIMTLGTYAQALTSDKRHAQSLVAELLEQESNCPHPAL